jgi:hypothetical protein
MNLRYVISAKDWNCRIISLDGKIIKNFIYIEYIRENYFEIREDILCININNIWQLQFLNMNDFDLFYQELEESFMEVFFKNDK